MGFGMSTIDRHIQAQQLNVVWERPNKDIRIAVDTPGDATYVTLWHGNRRIGDLATRIHSAHPDWLGISSVEIDGRFHGEGYGTRMYQILLSQMNPRFKGITSYLPDRANPIIDNIYGRMGGFEDGDYAFIPRPL